jgi:ACS family glucarate transporter-like MFS transporter
MTNAQPTHKRYILIVLLFFHTVHTYVDRICISAASGDIKSDLKLSDQMMGYIFGIFAFGYALFQIPSGWFADRFGPKKALSWVVVSWSSFTALTGAAWNGTSMLVFRFLFGVGEAGAFPGATRAFYNWIPANERGLANGIFHSGARVGAAASLFLLPILIHLVGWRWSFVINGAVGIVWVAVWLLWFQDKPRQHTGVNAAELAVIEKGISETVPVGEKVPIATLLTSANVLMVMLQYAASNITFFISFTWLLPYLESQWGQAAAMYAPVPLLFGVLAQWISGSLITLIYKRGYPALSRKLPAIAGFSLSVAGLLLLATVSDLSPLAFVLLFSIAVFGVEMTISPSWSLCMDIGGSNSGTVSAAMNMVGNIGSAVSAIMFPFFVSHVTIPFFATTGGTANSFFVFAAVMNLLGIGAWVYISPERPLQTRDTKGQRKKLVLFLLIIFLLAAGALLYKFLQT